jgi:hypothetical protein
MVEPRPLPGLGGPPPLAIPYRSASCWTIGLKRRAVDVCLPSQVLLRWPMHASVIVLSLPGISVRHPAQL